VDTVYIILTVSLRNKMLNSLSSSSSSRCNCNVCYLVINICAG